MGERMRFTDRSVERLEPRAQRFIIWADGYRGLGLRVSPRGEKSYVYSYRFAGRARMLTIGDAKGMTLSEAVIARNTAESSVRRANNMLSHGETPPADLDPGTKKRMAREARKVAETVSDLWDAYSKKRQVEWRARTAVENGRMWRGYLEGPLGKKLARDVRPKEVRTILDNIAEKAPVQANRVRALLSAIFRMAADRFIVDANPVQAVRRVASEAPRERALIDEAELRGFLAALGEPSWPSAERRGLLWTLATGCRPGEARALRYAQIDEAAATWTIPPEIAKTGVEHVVPLSPFALAILADCRAAGAVVDFAIAEPPGVAQLDRGALSESLRMRLEDLARHGVAKVRPHDLRRTCRTWLSKLGVDKDLAERCIGHVERDPMVRTYDRYQWLPEKRAAFEKWGKTLEAMSKLATAPARTAGKRGDADVEIDAPLTTQF